MSTDLCWIDEPLPHLRRPILVLAFGGLFDIAGVATAALHWLAQDRSVRSIARIDPDRFYDFSQLRPTVWLDDLGDRHVSWPENEAKVLSVAGSAHDLVLLAGVEPHLRWQSFATSLMELATAVNCETVVTVGGAAERVPHTRVPIVFGSSTNARLAAALGLSRPRYEGPTGLLGVLHALLDRSDIPAISLRVPVPHYLVNAQHPQSTAALLRHLEHVLGVPTRHGELSDEILRWREMHDSAVSSDTAARAYVRALERDFDALAEASIPSGDDLAAEFEAFLREQHTTGPDARSDPGAPSGSDTNLGPTDLPPPDEADPPTAGGTPAP